MNAVNSTIKQIATAVALALSLTHAPAMAKDDVHKGYSETAAQYEVNGNVISNLDVNATLWNPRGKSKEQVLERAKFMTKAYDLTRTEAQQKRAHEAKDKYKDAIYINSLMIGAVGEIMMTEDRFIVGIERNFNAGAAAVSPTAYAFPSDGPMPVIKRLENSNMLLAKMDNAVLVKDTKTIRQAKKDGKIAVMYNAQGADWAVDNLDMMDEVHQRGLRISNLIYNNQNAFASGGSFQGKGITEKGKKFVEKANELGIVMDCSHASNQTCIDVAKHTKLPMVATHSNPAALRNLGRNMSDEAMKAIANTDGAVCSVGVGLFMNDDLDSSPERLVEQILYTANLIGKDKTCYSTDYMHNAEDFFKRSITDVKVFPPEKGYGAPATNIATEHVWDIVAILEDKHNWTEDEIKGFLGENLLRVYSASWDK